MQLTLKKYFSKNTLIIGSLVVLFFLLRLSLIQNCLHLIHDFDSAELKHTYFSDLLQNENTSFFYFLKNINLYIPKSFHGGSFFPAYPVISGMYYILSLITGPTYYTIKLLTLLFTSITFLFWLILLRDNKKNLFLFATFFTFPPLYFLKWSLTLWGGSTECLFFYPLCIYLYLEVSNSTKSVLFKGFIYGFSVYFSYFCVPLVAVLFFPTAFKIFEENKKALPFFLIMMGLGFAPWLWHYGLVVETTKLTLLEPQQPTDFQHNLLLNILNGPYFEHAFSIKNIPWGKTGFIFLVSQLLCFPLAYLKNKDLKLKQIIIFLALMSAFFLVCISASSYNTVPSDLRYYIPLYPLYAIPLILTATSKKYQKLLSTPAIIILILFFAVNIRDNFLFYRLGYPDAKDTYKLNLHAFNKVTAPIETADNLNFFLEQIQMQRTTPFNKAVRAVFIQINGGRYFWPTDEHKQFLPSMDDVINSINKQITKFTEPDKEEDFFYGLGFGIYLKYEKTQAANDLIAMMPKEQLKRIMLGYKDAEDMLNKKDREL